jgi:hypothetical protein
MASTPIRDPLSDHLLTLENAAFLFIDYQPSQLAGVRSMDQTLLVKTHGHGDRPRRSGPAHSAWPRRMPASPPSPSPSAGSLALQAAGAVIGGALLRPGPLSLAGPPSPVPAQASTVPAQAPTVPAKTENGGA